MCEQKAVRVAELWERLDSMELEKRFEGRAYPSGMSSFPFRLSGQGFFPGGDGIWRDDTQISQKSSGLVAVGGAMFLGNDFGTLKSYERLRKKGFENPLTWKHVKRRVGRTDVTTSATFFTNAVMGLREDGTALEKKDWDALPQFRAFCREFLKFQIETLRPRLIVVMGPNPKKTLDSLSVGMITSTGRFPNFQVGDHVTTLYFSTHPYGDFNFDEARKTSDGSELQNAWTHANLK